MTTLYQYLWYEPQIPHNTLAPHQIAIICNVCETIFTRVVFDTKARRHSLLDTRRGGCIYVVTHCTFTTRTLIHSALAEIQEIKCTRNKRAWITHKTHQSRMHTLDPRARTLSCGFRTPHCLTTLENSFVRFNGVAKFLQLGRGEFASSSLAFYYNFNSRARRFMTRATTLPPACVCARCKVRPRSIISSLLPREAVSAAISQRAAMQKVSHA